MTRLIPLGKKESETWLAAMRREQEEAKRELTPEEISDAQRFNAELLVKGMQRGLREIWTLYALLFGLVALLGWCVMH